MSRGWQREQKSRSRAEMVLALKNIIEEYSLGALKDAKAVYYAEARGSDTHLLTPAWQVECEQGSFTVSLIDKGVLEISVK